MKVDNVSHLATPSRIDPGKGGQKVGGAAAGERVAAQPSTHLSHLGSGDASQDIDQARVAEVRQAIADGSLKVDTNRIADRLIASVRDLVGGQS
ncbi:MAG TPA: flagellar biosynthesis anti-sigma factor FlgM [Rhodanobacteraceae bacterium]|nr:flagellar biosynthesis anti-sigma factor FlgM [Rhodanobacteraceae bacterium]